LLIAIFPDIFYFVKLPVEEILMYWRENRNLKVIAVGEMFARSVRD
jgi:hypothetical protein